MKKAISLILAVFMLCTMMAAPSFAAAEYTVVQSFFSTDTGVSTQFNNGTVNEVSGIRGRSADDTSIYSTRVIPASETNTGNHKVQYIISPGTADDKYGDLLVFGASFCVQKNIGHLYLSGNGSIPISNSYTIDSEYNFNNGWNKLVFVYDHSTADSTQGSGYYAGSWALYVNGKRINALGENSKELASDNNFNSLSKGKLNQMRIVFSCADSSELGIYLDDAYAYSVSTTDKEGFMAQFEEEAPAVLEASGDEYTLNGTSIIAKEGATVASVNVTEGTTVRAFLNDEYSTELASTAALEYGNEIVVSKNGILQYYTVTDEASANNLIYATRFSNEAYPSGLSLANNGYFTSDFVSGKTGKNSSDMSLNFGREAAPGLTSSWNGNNIYTYIKVPVDKTYIKYEVNFMPGDDNFSYMGFRTQGHGGIAPNLYCNDEGDTAHHCLNRYQWNKIVYVFKNNTTTIDTTSTQITGTYDLYVNGVQISDNVATSLKKMNSSATSTTTPIRLAIYGNDVTTDTGVDFSAISTYIDDIDVRWYDTEPEIAPLPCIIEDGENVVVNGGICSVREYLTAGELECSSGTTLTIYGDSTLTSTLSANDILLDGNVIVLSNSRNDIRYYTVSSGIKRIPVSLVEKRSEASELEGTIIYRATKSLEYGIGGKSSTDASGRFDGQSEPVTDADFFIASTASSAMQEDDISVSAMIYPNDTIKEIFFATGTHAPLSSIVIYPSLVPDSWNRLTLLHHPDTGVSELYLNDEYVSSTSQAIKSNALRLVFRYATEEIGDSYIQYDDYFVYSGEIAVPAITSEKYSLENIKVNGYGNDTAADIKANLTPALDGYTFSVLDGEGNPVSDSETVDSSCTVVVYDGDVQVSSYGFGVADYEISDDVVIMAGSFVTADNKFGPGEVTVEREIFNYGDEMEILSVAAQYDASGNMLGASINPQTITSNGSARAVLNAKESEGSYIKFMVLDKASLKPLATPSRFESYATDVIESAVRLYEGYTTKSMAFNYDDCRWEDQHLIELLDQYGMKGTFNLVSGKIITNLKSLCKEQTGNDDDASVLAFAKEMYKNHEISNHTVSHKPSHLNPGEIGYDSHGNMLVGASTEDEIADIVGCPVYIKENLGVEAIGMAWPNGFGTSRDDYETDLYPAMVGAGIKYARAAANGSFALPEDWYRWNSTCHHNDSLVYARNFVALENSGDLKCFFNWGHSYEFEQNVGNELKDWTMIENVMKILQPDNIWFATNGDIYRYVEATKLVEVTETTVTNNSDMTVYYNINGSNVELAPGEVYSVAE